MVDFKLIWSVTEYYLKNENIPIKDCLFIEIESFTFSQFCAHFARFGFILKGNFMFICIMHWYIFFSPPAKTFKISNLWIESLSLQCSLQNLKNSSLASCFPKESCWSDWERSVFNVWVNFWNFSQKLSLGMPFKGQQMERTITSPLTKFSLI